MLESVFCKAGGLKALRDATLLKKRLQHRFFTRICEVFKNNFSYRTSPMAASVSLGMRFLNLLFAEAATRGCSVKMMFSIISQDSQESTCGIVSFLKETLALVFSCESWKILKYIFLCTTLVAASIFGFNGFHGIKGYYCNFTKKETLALVFSSKSWEILKYIFLCTTLVAASIFAFNGFHGIKGYYCNFIKKETLAQVFSCEFCETSKNTFFTEQLWTTASFRSKNILKIQSLF